MARRALAAGILLILCVAASAIQWPSEPSAVRSEFGSYVGGYLRGMAFAGGGAPVRAPEDGELVFAYGKARLPDGFPLALASVAAYAHPGGMLSVLSGMQPASMADYKARVKAGETLGMGLEGERQLRFELFDLQNRRYVNPRMLLPPTADPLAPTLRGAWLVSGAAEQPLERSVTVRQGNYSLALDAAELMPQGQTGMPFRVTALLDGAIRFDWRHDAAWSSGGRGMIVSADPRVERELYDAAGRLRLGPLALSRGRSLLTVRLTDFAGNAREFSYAVVVQ